MPQSLSRVLIHLVFSTKNRAPLIALDRQDRMYAYIGGTLNNIGCAPIRIGGVADHVHLFFVQARTHSLSKIVEELKKESSKWANVNVSADFYWQNGYGAFSVSPSKADDVVKYIARQHEHHEATTFQDEFRALLHRHAIEWDERYVWD